MTVSVTNLAANDPPVVRRFRFAPASPGVSHRSMSTGPTTPLLSLALACCFGITQVGCRPAPSMLELHGRTMGTTYTVKAVAVDGVSSSQLQQAVEKTLESVNDQMSTYRPESEISRFNASRSTDWFSVSPETASVVEFAQRLSAISGGRFDITVAPMVNAWHFGPQLSSKNDSELPPDDGQSAPSPEQLEKLRKLVGYQRLDVRLDPPALRKDVPELSIDLSAIAKGHGVDRVLATLEDLNIRQAFVEIGGEVRCAGTRPDGRPWQVGIERPEELASGVWRIVALNDGQAMATSGDYRNSYVATNGQRVSHTIDPFTGRPLEHSVASVSVVADNCMAADAWATALNVLGPEQGLRLASEQGLDVLMILRDGPRLTARGVGRLRPRSGPAQTGEESVEETAR